MTNKNAKSKIDWSAVLEVLILIVSAIKELVKQSNEQKETTEKSKKIDSKDKEI